MNYGDSLKPYFDPTVSIGVSAYTPVFGVTFEIGLDVDYLLSNSN